jgi:flagellar basal-body rod protein FlgB
MCSPKTSPILIRPNSNRAIWSSNSSGAPARSIGTLAMLRTSASHIAPSGDAAQSFDVNRSVGFQTRPAGNAVSLEEEMMKVSANQMDYAAVTSLYSKSLHLLKTAIGKG